MNQIYLLIVGICLLIINQSCRLNNQNESYSFKNESFNEFFDKYSNDSLRNEIFKIAYENKSTAPSYVVFIAKDLNTGETKEICCEAPFLSGAMHRNLTFHIIKKELNILIV